MRRLAERYPLGVFTVLACALTWALLPLAAQQPIVGVVALLGPAVAALTTAVLSGGDAVVRLRERVVRWRVSWRWYLVALLLPLPISLLAVLVQQRLGASGPIALAPLSLLGMVVFVMVLGEEIGWRGFALPLLMERVGPTMASLVLGVIWACWHLPLFVMASMPQYGTPFLAYTIYTIALSVLLTFLALRTRGSVVIATLFHGAVNTFILVNESATAVQRGWGNAVAFGGAALLVMAWGGLQRGPHRT